jgi:hypothetical protein
MSGAQRRIVVLGLWGFAVALHIFACEWHTDTPAEAAQHSNKRIFSISAFSLYADGSFDAQGGIAVGLFLPGALVLAAIFFSLKKADVSKPGSPQRSPAKEEPDRFGASNQSDG